MPKSKHRKKHKKKVKARKQRVQQRKNAYYKKLDELYGKEMAKRLKEQGGLDEDPENLE